MIEPFLFSIEVPSSPVTLLCVKLTKKKTTQKPNQHKHEKSKYALLGLLNVAAYMEALSWL